ncbi:hypothetical protein [Dyadobacter sp. MSC1_007]|jgi:hypothetical protein|uniref:hypothetical protein n=1 Tax=Dyadobacter sp. MSC1_007 TaxID=2909264 RepID=UPI0020304C8E|nr:hypothetical protein [Dyadobacter sp. MSC1_007]
MFNNAALDVVIGLIFIYLLYSLLATILCEWIVTFIGLRGKALRKIIFQMLNDDKSEIQDLTKLGNAFYRHPGIKYMIEDLIFLKKNPVYISKETFSKVVIDLLRGQNVVPGQSFRQPIQNSLDNAEIAWKFSKCQEDQKQEQGAKIDSETLSYLKSMWADSQGDVQKFRAHIEIWYTEMMDKCTGVYKKYNQMVLLGVGLFIAILFNVDSIKIAKKLENNPAIAKRIVSQASDFRKANPNLFSSRAVESPKDSTITERIQERLDNKAMEVVSEDIGKTNDLLALGWSSKGKNCDGYSILGWILTAIAISFGAPFWFDLLNKLMSLRAAIAPKEEEIQKKNSGSAASNATKIKIDG